MKMAGEMNAKYGLSITKHIDSSTYHRTETEPSYKGLFPLLVEYFSDKQAYFFAILKSLISNALKRVL